MSKVQYKTNYSIMPFFFQLAITPPTPLSCWESLMLLGMLRLPRAHTTYVFIVQTKASDTVYTWDRCSARRNAALKESNARGCGKWEFFDSCLSFVSKRAKGGKGPYLEEDGYASRSLEG